MLFVDRREAGRRLGAELVRQGFADVVVVALPRGGVPVAAEVAISLGAPLDIMVVRKLGCPWQPELGMGAIGEGGVRVLNGALIAQLGITSQQVEAVTRAEQTELERRVRRYRGDRPAVALGGRTVVLVDDGLATGFTARTAITVAREQGASRVVLAVPVAPAATVGELAMVADKVVCLLQPQSFMAIGEWYRDFEQTSDQEVITLLAEAAGRAGDPNDPSCTHLSATGAPGAPAPTRTSTEGGR
jgi:putative phosphoribosyl transferase